MHTPLPVNLGFLSCASDCNSEHAILGDPIETSPGQRVCREAKSHVQGAVLSWVHTAPHAQVYTCTHALSLNIMVMTLVYRAVMGVEHIHSCCEEGFLAQTLGCLTRSHIHLSSCHCMQKLTTSYLSRFFSTFCDCIAMLCVQDDLHIYDQHVCSLVASANSQSAHAPSSCIRLLENTTRNGQVHTCVTMAGAKQNVQALCLDGPVRVHIHRYGGCPRLQTGLGQGTAAACVSHTPSIVSG